MAMRKTGLALAAAAALGVLATPMAFAQDGGGGAVTPDQLAMQIAQAVATLGADATQDDVAAMIAIVLAGSDTSAATQQAALAALSTNATTTTTLPAATVATVQRVSTDLTTDIQTYGAVSSTSSASFPVANTGALTVTFAGPANGVSANTVLPTTVTVTTITSTYQS